MNEMVDKITEMVTSLSKYGIVTRCEQIDEDLFTVEMEFDPRAESTVTHECLGIIQKSIGDTYTHTKSCEYDTRKFKCTLRAF